MAQSICILGATGSIGESTLKVLAQHPEEYNVFAITAYSRLERMVEICQKFQPKIVVVPQDKKDKAALLLSEKKLSHIEILTDVSGLVYVASHENVDVVMAAIVGAAGLVPTLAAVNAGKRVLLANKEALVMSGDLMMQAAKKNHALLLPVDSEHNAIFQCLPQNYEKMNAEKAGVSQILLTASGGPFLQKTLDDLKKVTPEQACKHPNWSMGQKISVDSATLMNKGLELIEACHLFSISENLITVVVHPQSIIHSMVQYVDGSTLAQMGNPDMCTPIAHALAWPKRMNAPVLPLNLFLHQQLNFEAPDNMRFPSLSLARNAMKTGGLAPTILNAANEIAVDAFLNKKIGFMDIPNIVDRTLQCLENGQANHLDIILQTDQRARLIAQEYVGALI